MIACVFSDENAGLSQELYSAFWKGFPIENLKPLLVSDVPHIKSLGSYLVYELGAKVCPLIAEVTASLDDDDPQIRSDAILALPECATKFDKEPLGKIILLLNDPDPFAQRGAIRFVLQSERSILVAAVEAAALTSASTVFEKLPKYLRWYHSHRVYRGKVRTEARQNPDLIINGLFALNCLIAGRFAVGLSARLQPVINTRLLECAEQFNDESSQQTIEFRRKQPFPQDARLMVLY